MARAAKHLLIAASALAGCSQKRSGECLSNVDLLAPFVNVVVLDATSGQPLCGVAVSLSGPAPAKPLQPEPAKGDASCFYAIELGAAIGAYTITASAPGFQTASEVISVSSETCGQCCTASVLVRTEAGPVNNGTFWVYMLPIHPQ